MPIKPEDYTELASMLINRIASSGQHAHYELASLVQILEDVYYDGAAAALLDSRTRKEPPSFDDIA